VVISSNIATVSYCAINSGRVIVNGKTLFDNQSEVFFKSSYEALELNYPKFFKMDELSKLCFLTTEYLMLNKDFSNTTPEEKAIVVHNRNSSLISDRKFSKSCEDVPSPSHFVYTLPNVMIGEVCIRNHIKGENHCFISETYEHEFQFELIKKLLLRGNKVCIHGWVDFGEHGYSSLLFLTTNDDKNNGSYFDHNKINQIIEEYARAY
jgi:hypothetical protein